MKKFAGLLAALLLMAGIGVLAGCGGAGAPNSDGFARNATPTPSPTPTATPTPNFGPPPPPG